jgi:hypothetical protein
MKVMFGSKANLATGPIGVGNLAPPFDAYCASNGLAQVLKYATLSA